jgi:hypothetical protein
MHQLFARAAQRLKELLEAGREEEARKLVEDLGKEALAESSGWLLLHRDRPLEMPKPL